MEKKKKIRFFQIKLRGKGEELWNQRGEAFVDEVKEISIDLGQKILESKLDPAKQTTVLEEIEQFFSHGLSTLKSLAVDKGVEFEKKEAQIKELYAKIELLKLEKELKATEDEKEKLRLDYIKKYANLKLYKLRVENENNPEVLINIKDIEKWLNAYKEIIEMIGK